jgi:hypothetical protein
VRPECAIFDFDGTLASVAWIAPTDNHDSSQWHRFNHLTPYCSPVPYVLMMVWDCVHTGVTPIITTGRDESFRHNQLTWLRKYNIPVRADHVFGRAYGDPRKDSIVKEEILHRDILPRWHPIYAVDDRPVVAQVWRTHGIRTIDVIDPGLDPAFLLGAP